jgi:hypothetical protein
MSILDDLLSAITSAIKSIVDFVVDLFTELLPLIMVVAVIYFAPAIGSWFTANGMGSIGTFFNFIGTQITPSVVDGVSWLAQELLSMGSAAYTNFKSLEIGAQLAAVGGAMALLAPEETAVVMEEVGTTATDLIVTGLEVVGDASGSIVDTLLSNPLVLGLGAGALYLLTRGSGATATLSGGGSGLGYAPVPIDNGEDQSVEQFWSEYDNQAVQGGQI